MSLAVGLSRSSRGNEPKIQSASGTNHLAIGMSFGDGHDGNAGDDQTHRATLLEDIQKPAVVVMTGMRALPRAPGTRARRGVPRCVDYRLRGMMGPALRSEKEWAAQKSFRERGPIPNLCCLSRRAPSSVLRRPSPDCVALGQEPATPARPAWKALRSWC